jgi:hypothetical protein
MNVGSCLKRTRKTNLIEEELLILDVLFDASDTFEALVRENYASSHNLPYTHSLDAGSLRALIDKLMRNGIVQSHTSGPSNRLFYGLTEAGGKLWEVERAPDWERYCADSSTLDETGKWILSVESPSITTAKAFVTCAKDCLLYRFNEDDIRTKTRIEDKISTVEWRAFPSVCSISVRTYPLPEINLVDWNTYESHRTWWRGLTELAKFQAL